MKNESPEFSGHCDYLGVVQYRVLLRALQLPIPWNTALVTTSWVIVSFGDRKMDLLPAAVRP
jgi:hypothetical protein